MAVRKWRRSLLALTALVSGLRTLVAQGTPPIMDNSFLMEEAYNQERGMVQHISLFSHQREPRTWAYSFTQEWPFRGQRHQLSYTAQLILQVGPAGPRTGFGDLMLNYRLQLVGREGKRVWVAPRLSAVLPTGRWEQGRGDGRNRREESFVVPVPIVFIIEFPGKVVPVDPAGKVPLLHSINKQFDDLSSLRDEALLWLFVFFGFFDYSP